MLSPSFTRPPAVASGRPKTEAHARAEENARLVWAVIARRFPFLHRDPDRREDAYAAGYVELLGACARWDASRGYTFATYAYRYIEGGILRWLKQERDQGRVETVSLEMPIGDGGGELADLIEDPQAEKPGEALSGLAGFEALLADLDGRQAAILRALYQEELTLDEAAARLGMTKQRVHQVRAQALRAIRKRLAEEAAAAQRAEGRGGQADWRVDWQRQADRQQQAN